MKVLKIVVIIVVILIVVIAALGIIAPKDYHIERSSIINAPPAVIMDHVKSLKKMQAWSPWADYDTNMIVTYEGTDGEVGSSSSWEGNKQVGKGKQEITAISDSRVDTKITFIEPWQSVSYAYIEADPQEDGTRVTWGFNGSSPFPMNIFSLFMDMDEMVGKDFDRGLAKLKDISEQAAGEYSNMTNGYNIQEVQWVPKTYYGKKGTVQVQEIGKFYSENFPAIAGSVSKAGLNITGSPAGIYFNWDEATKTAEMAAALPVEATPDTKLDNYERFDIGESKALLISYYGSYEGTEKAHQAMENYLEQNGLTLNKTIVEEYVTDPTSEPDTSKWLTNIYYLIE